jgi:AcrR family transcriptional regulator
MKLPIDADPGITYRSVVFMARHGPETGRLILQAALKRFANAGYAATSVQQIVNDARVSKPALYYHFQDKAGLFKALVHEAHDARHQVICEAAAKGRNLRAQLEHILTDLFDYISRNRELTRISFATMFAAPGEVPPNLDYADKCERNFEFIHSLIKQAQENGELDRRFGSRELTYGFYGLANFYVVSPVVTPGCVPDTGAAKRIVDLFLSGAGPRPPAQPPILYS